MEQTSIGKDGTNILEVDIVALEPGGVEEAAEAAEEVGVSQQPGVEAAEIAPLPEKV